MQSLTKSQRLTLLRILLSAVLLILAKLLPPVWHPFVLYLIPYALIGWDILWKAVRNILHGQVFDENFLMALATVGAFFTGEYAEAVFVMLFYQVGELFQDYAVGKSRKSIAALMDIRPDVAHLEQTDGSLAEIDPEDVAVGSVIVVKPGERGASGRHSGGRRFLPGYRSAHRRIRSQRCGRGRQCLQAAASIRRGFCGSR